jgi:hypothetical protein
MKWRFLCSQDCMPYWVQHGAGVGNSYDPGNGFGGGGSSAGNGRSDPSDDNGDGRGVSPFVTDIRDSVIPLPEGPT